MSFHFTVTLLTSTSKSKLQVSSNAKGRIYCTGVSRAHLTCKTGLSFSLGSFHFNVSLTEGLSVMPLIFPVNSEVFIVQFCRMVIFRNANAELQRDRRPLRPCAFARGCHYNMGTGVCLTRQALYTCYLSELNLSELKILISIFPKKQMKLREMK